MEGSGHRSVLMLSTSPAKGPLLEGSMTDERAAEDWMNPREEDPLSLKRLLVPAPSELLVMQPASPLANSVKNEGPALLEL